jgi:cell division inhibitor SepF
MAGMLRKSLVYLGLAEDENQSYDDEDGYDEAEEVPARRRPAERTSDPHEEYARAPVRRVEETRVTAVSAAARPVGWDDEATMDTYRITALHPRTYNDAKSIGEHFRDNTPVIMNLTEMDDADAKRLVDFSAGLIFGLHGSIERITSKVFLLSPANVEVTAEDKARIAQGGFFNQS